MPKNSEAGVWLNKTSREGQSFKDMQKRIDRQMMKLRILFFGKENISSNSKIFPTLTRGRVSRIFKDILFEKNVSLTPFHFRIWLLHFRLSSFCRSYSRKRFSSKVVVVLSTSSQNPIHFEIKMTKIKAFSVGMNEKHQVYDVGVGSPEIRFVKANEATKNSLLQVMVRLNSYFSEITSNFHTNLILNQAPTF